MDFSNKTLDMVTRKYNNQISKCKLEVNKNSHTLSSLHYLYFTLCDHVLFLSVILYQHDETCALGSRVANKLIYS